VTKHGRSPDTRLLRGVRLRLIAWSAGSTLLVLTVLGTALYVAVSQTLVAQSTQTLERRIDAMRDKVVAEGEAESSARPSAAGQTQPQETRPAETKDPAPTPDGSPAVTPATGSSVPPAANSEVNVTNDASQPGYLLGGPSSGTLAFMLDPDSKAAIKLVPSADGTTATWDIPEIDDAKRTAALAGQTVAWEGDLHGTPARFVLESVNTAAGPILIESIGDRTSEILLLRTLLIVLLAGSLAVVAASMVFGYFYAGRALVPIRGSLQQQRDFAADASHEFRTPLAIVRGALDELRAAPAGADTERSLADIEAGAERLGHLVDDLLFLARADSGAIQLRREPADLAEIATDSTGRLARHAAAADVRLRLEVAPAPVMGDPDRLGQVVAILVDNAIRHSPSGGTVTVTVRDGATLIVEDDGPGVRTEDLTRLFDRFWRAPDAPPGGTGLGLSIAAWIVAGHGGRIYGTNRETGGAHFEVVIPGRRS
jgi:signal transduction histidine kinase